MSGKIRLRYTVFLIRFFLIVGVIFNSSIGFSAEAIPDEVPIIPRRHLFDHSQISSARLSPDGLKIAYLAPDNGNVALWIKILAKNEAFRIPDTDKMHIASLLWTKDSSHVLFLADTAGNENYVVYGVVAENGLLKRYTPAANVTADIISCDTNDPAQVLIAMNTEHPQFHDAYSLNLNTRETIKIASNPGTVMLWISDNSGQILGALNATSDGNVDLMVRESVTSEWHRMLTWSDGDLIASSPLGFSNDGRFIFLRDSRNSNTTRVVKIELKTGIETVIASDQLHDIETVLNHPVTHEIQAYLVNHQYRDWHVMDPSVIPDFELLKSFRSGQVMIVDRSQDDTKWLVEYCSDTRPPGIYLYDRSTGQVSLVNSEFPIIEKYILAPTLPFECRSRDGLRLNGYITYPPTIRKTGLPVVLRVHGGPYIRDSWEYNPEVQWLANRGFACIQINYRGSCGYGKEFLNISRKEWGGKMHDDLIDTVAWAVTEGIADPRRIAIMGTSYGGYASLIGATFTPDTFCCAISAMGPSNLVSFLKSLPVQWSTQRRFLCNRIGDPDTETEFLLSRSPITKVDNIKIPILIAQGANDVRVRLSDGEQIIDAIRQKGLRYRYLVFNDEGHSLSKVENRLKFYAAAERFLAVNLQGRLEEPAY